MHRLLFRAVNMATMVYIVGSVEAFSFIDREIYGTWSGKGGDRLTAAFSVLQIITGVYMFFRAYRQTRRIGTGAMFALILAGYIMMTALWSIDPQTTVRRATLYLFVVVGAIGIAGLLRGDDYMELLFLACGGCAVLSVLLYIANPYHALMPDGSGAFRGIFGHKNVAGQVMAAGALAALHRLRVNRRQRLATIAMLGLFTLLAVAARSATAFMTIFAYCGVDGGLRLLRAGGAARLVCIGLVILVTPVVVLVMLYPDAVLEMIGKDPTLTGRTELWTWVLNAISQRPVLGWGYAAFWSPNNPAADEISRVLQWYVPQAHNGLLEMALNVGFVGAAYYIFLLISAVWCALRSLRTSERELAASTIACCIGILLTGLSESVLVEPFQPDTSVFFVTALICERAMRAGRRGRTRIATPVSAVPHIRAVPVVQSRL
jgi:exopolysaccharide production protein ExoQ